MPFGVLTLAVRNFLSLKTITTVLRK